MTDPAPSAANAAIGVPSHVQSMPAGQGSVLLDLASDRYYTLNATAAVVWRILSGGGSPDDAARALCEEFDVAADEAAASVRAFVDELAREDLVRAAGAHPLAPEETSHGQAKA